MSAAIDWLNLETWGAPATCVHVGTTVPDRHDASEAAAEGRRG